MLQQLVLAAAGSAGFAILFGLRRKWIGMIFIAGGLAWYGYILLYNLTQNQISAMFFITVLVVVLAKFLTVFAECPVILFTTPILIPFIPGATLYYLMSDLLSGRAAAAENARLLVYQVGAMALGILVAEMIVLLHNRSFSAKL